MVFLKNPSKELSDLKDPYLILDGILKKHCVFTQETLVLDYNCVPDFDEHLGGFDCCLVAACPTESLKKHALSIVKYPKFAVCSQTQLNDMDCLFDYIFVIDYALRRTFIKNNDLQTIHKRLKSDGKFIMIYLPPFAVYDKDVKEYFDIVEQSAGEFYMQNVLVAQPKRPIF